MAGFVFLQDGSSIEFHTGFPRVNPEDVQEIQLDCDELDRGLRLWPEAVEFTPNQGSRVQNWIGASARRFACKFLDERFAREQKELEAQLADFRKFGYSR